MTYADLAQNITNVRFGKITEKTATIEFNFAEKTIIITEPEDVCLSDNDASKRWIANNYGFILSCVGQPTCNEKCNAAVIDLKDWGRCVYVSDSESV